MNIYHGSEKIIEKPIFGYGKKHNDFGIGFYCTEQIELANEWAVDFNRDGYCNEYSLDLEGLEVLRLNSSEFTILHWITILIQNRTFDIQTDFAKEAIAYLNDNFSVSYDTADIIIGYRADDSYFSYASDFLNNTISIQTLSRAMKLGNLGEQIVIKSEKAFSRLKFDNAQNAKAMKWYGAKMERDRLARNTYQEMRKEPWSKGNLYIMGILDQEVKAWDERLRL